MGWKERTEFRERLNHGRWAEGHDFFVQKLLELFTADIVLVNYIRVWSMRAKRGGGAQTYDRTRRTRGPVGVRLAHLRDHAEIDECSRSASKCKRKRINYG